MYSWIKSSLTLSLLLATVSLQATPSPSYKFGQAISAEDIKPWDIDINPDGIGLPQGQATADEGEEVYLQKCAACHGEFGEGVGRFPSLIGEVGDLTAERAHKSVGGFWPYSTTLWDYINRAMPFGNAQSLTPDEVYGVVAYILSMNEIIESDMVINAKILPTIKMPNRAGFIHAETSDINVPVCMTNCVTDISIKTTANQKNKVLKGE